MKLMNSYKLLCVPQRKDFELHPFKMKPNVTEVKIPKNIISKWNIDIQGQSVLKGEKKKKEIWSSKYSVGEVK